MSERTRIQRKKSGDGEREVAPPIVHEALRAGGEPLDEATRAFMEPQFGYDFGRVRVHTGETAAQSAQAVNALAFTAGHDVVFGAGQYRPGMEAGRQLIAHELVHVVQFSSAGSAPDFSRISPRNHPSEDEARNASVNNYHQQLTVQPIGIALQEAGSGQPQTMNDRDPRNPRNYPSFEAFAQGYQEAEQRSIPEEELHKIWNEAQPIQHPTSGIYYLAGGMAARGGITATQAYFAPVDAKGVPLEGPLNLYSGKAARQAAEAAPGHMIRDTVYYVPAEEAENALYKQLGIPKGEKLPPELYDPIWERASRRAVRDATLGGLGATSHNDPFNLIPKNVELPPGSNGLPLGSIQAKVELRWLRGLGVGMGALTMGSGVVTIVGSIKESKETRSPVPAAIGVIGGSLEGTGGLAYLVGALGADGAMMAAGVAIAETGGVIAVPLIGWEGMKLAAEKQRESQSTVGNGDISKVALGGSRAYYMDAYGKIRLALIHDIYAGDKLMSQTFINWISDDMANSFISATKDNFGDITTISPSDITGHIPDPVTGK